VPGRPRVPCCSSLKPPRREPNPGPRRCGPHREFGAPAAIAQGGPSPRREPVCPYSPGCVRSPILRPMVGAAPARRLPPRDDFGQARGRVDVDERGERDLPGRPHLRSPRPPGPCSRGPSPQDERRTGSDEKGFASSVAALLVGPSRPRAASRRSGWRQPIRRLVGLAPRLPGRDLPDHDRPRPRRHGGARLDAGLATAPISSATCRLACRGGPRAR
jgi:hypothetical protein